MPQSRLHPTKIWYVLLQVKHRLEEDMHMVHSYYIYDEKEAKEFASKYKQNVIFFGEFTLSKQYRVIGGD